MGKLLTLDEALKPALPVFFALLDVPVDDPEWQELDPPQRRQRTLDAIKHLILRESRVQPLILIFEDLHWIDTETRELLDSLVEGVARRPSSPARELPAGVPARMDPEDLLHAAPPRSAAAGERRGAAAGARGK